jgi:hypothetical protein
VYTQSILGRGRTPLIIIGGSRIDTTVVSGGVLVDHDSAPGLLVRSPIQQRIIIKLYIWLLSLISLKFPGNV